MGSLWLACCSSSDAAAVRQEVAARDAAAQIVRVRDLNGFAAMVGVLSHARPSIALVPRELNESLERAIEELAHCEGITTILVLLHDLDPAWVARLCYAGATEVVAADADIGDKAQAPTCTEEESCARDERQALVERYDPEVPPWDMPKTWELTESPEEAPTGQGEDGDDRDRSEGDGVGKDLGSERRVPDTPHRETPVAGWRDRASEGKGASDATAAPSRTCGIPDGLRTPAPNFHASPIEHGPESTGYLHGHRAPVVAAISGRGGCGKSTVLAAMAWSAARMGMRSAVVDLDLMFGNQHELLGVETLCDLAGLLGANGAPPCSTAAIEGTAMRIAPGLTLWGPCAVPEQAELLSKPSEQLIGVLRYEADVIFVDTPVSWGDAAASAVSCCDRCLVVGGAGVSAEPSLARAVELACRIGVPRTRMTCVYNRYVSPEHDEDRAMRLEMAVSLRSRVRIADGGSELSELLAFGQIGDAMAQESSFSHDVQQATYEILKELGCPLETWEEQQRQRLEKKRERPRIHLPWKREEAGVR